MAKLYEQLESPFLDEELFIGDRETIDDANATNSADEALDDDVDEESGEEELAETHVDAGADDDWEATEDADEADLAEAFAVAAEEETEPEDEPADEVGEPDLEWEMPGLAPADTIDALAAQPAFPPVVRLMLGPLLDAPRARTAAAWNAARHPTLSGIAAATLLARLDVYVDRALIESLIAANVELRDAAADQQILLAVVAHQFQQKIYADAGAHHGKIGEGVLDALGFVRHRDATLNQVDGLNASFHVDGNSKAYKRVKEAYRTDGTVFATLGADVTPKSWYALFVNAPFLGRPFVKGVHVELMRRLRKAEAWLRSRPPYQAMSAVEMGTALGITEDHRGGRTKNNSSMHTLGLAVDIGYDRNPWVTGQQGPTGKANDGRNEQFQSVSRNVSHLLAGIDEVLTPEWLSRLGSDPHRSTDAAFSEIQTRHARFIEYLALEKDANRLRGVIEQRRQGPRPDLVIERNETTDAAVARWQAAIRKDRARLAGVVGSNRRATDGFMNLHHDLVVALRDHGCLAWGAIDLGRNQSGDMMHFDCRATGIGWTLALEKQRTVRGGHPCASISTAGAEPVPAAASPAAASPAAASPAAASPPTGGGRPATELTRFAQRVLNAAEGEHLADDGDFGPRTKTAVDRFRRAHALGAGGVLDTPTTVALVQRALETLKQQSMFAQPGTVDARTREELAAFKAERGLGVDAEIDAATRLALTDALAGRPAVTSAMPSAVPVSSSAIAQGSLSAQCIQRITALADPTSDLARFTWADKKERAPIGYLKGMMLVYARAYAKWKTGDRYALEMAKAASTLTGRDALAWYANQFAAAGMSNAQDGADTLRHLFVLLTGLGMRESTGRYCAGRDMSADNTSPNTAEAGLFQMSYYVGVGSSDERRIILKHQYASLRTSGAPSFAEVFKEGVRCASESLTGLGTTPGDAFREFCVRRPDLSAEIAALGLRVRRQHWGPIKNRHVTVSVACDAALAQVQAIVDAGTCGAALLGPGGVSP